MAINTIRSLQEHLQLALEIEHAVVPPYLSALYSIKAGHSREAVEVITSVFLEEMLHMTLVANLLNAVGGEPQIDKAGFIPTYPTRLPHSNRTFQISLLKFCPDAVDAFLRIEKPEAHGAIPQDDNYETLGQFYEAIAEGLERLCRELGEAIVFSGNPARQVTDKLYYGGSGRIIAVTDMRSALAALGEIIEQGEGMDHKGIWDGDRNMFHAERQEVGHYFRFDEIRTGRSYQQGDTPQSGPTGEPFIVEWDAVYNMRPNPRTQDYPEDSEIRHKMDDFNRTYSSILHLLHECFNGKPNLLAVATGAMYELKQQAIDLMQTPTGDGATTAGPSFEYVPPERRHRMAHLVRKIVVMANGPYLVYGDIPLTRKTTVFSEYGEPLTWQKVKVFEAEETYALCRCGQSSNKPFCDGTHARVNFDGTETADPEPTTARQLLYPGTRILVKRDGSLCAHAGFCGNRLANIVKLVAETADSQVRAQIIAMAERCPSGSYTYAMEPDGENIEPDLPQAIAVTTDGPLWVMGEIPIGRADGQPLEVRNRVTLCRCGHSKNKPLCDGSHEEIGFVG